MTGQSALVYHTDRLPTSMAKRFLLLVALPMLVVLVGVLALWSWAAWKDSQTQTHLRRMKDAEALCVAEAHRVHPEAVSLRVYIGDEFGDDHGQVLAQLPNSSGLEIWVYSGNGGFWNSCRIRSAEPIDESQVKEDVSTQPYGTVTRYP